MWPAISEVGAALCAGVAVKLMDDALDAPLDAAGGWVTVGGSLGPAATPYGLLALLAGMALDAPMAGGLFLAAYAAGMAGGLAQRMPTGLPAWAESLLVLVGGVLWLGPQVMAARLLAVTAIQLVDDALDRDSPFEQLCGPEALWLGAAAALAGGFWLDGARLLAPLAAALAVGVVMQKRGGETVG